MSAGGDAFPPDVTDIVARLLELSNEVLAAAISTQDDLDSRAFLLHTAGALVEQAADARERRS